MDYFKSAASAFLAKGGPLPGYSIGDKDAWFEGRSIWSLCSATKRDDGSSCSVLVFDALQPAHNPRRSILPLAKNALRRLRTVRHPDVIKLIDSAETPTAVYIVTESVRPLGKVLESMKGSRHQRDEWVCWGLSKVSNAVRFINQDMKATHGNLRTDSVFLASSGEWRLGGLEALSAIHDESPVLYNMGSLLPDAARYAPPEVKQQGWSVLRDLPPASADSWGLSLIAVEAYNGTLPPAISGLPAQGRVPDAQYKLLKRMMLPNAKARLSAAQFLEAGQAPGSFFSENRLVKVASGLDGFLLAREDERADIVRQIRTSADSFPPDFLQYKVLPALISAVGLAATSAVASASAAPASRLLPLILQLASPLSDTDWHNSVAPTVFKAFTSPDRSLRMTLLEALPTLSVRFDARQVSDKIWPNLLTGFGDSAAAIREATVKSILPLSEKLSDRILNNDLLRQLARTQVDVEPSIRTNTTILLGNLAPKLSAQTHKKVLIPAFVRSLHDPFTHARNAGIMAFLATSASFDGEDSAKHILPAMCPCLVDPEKIVREQAKAAVAAFLAKAEEAAAGMKDTSSAEEGNHENGIAGTREDSVASTAAGAASLLSRYTKTLAGEAPAPEQAPASASNNGSLHRTSIISSSDGADAPSWAQSGNLMDVMDDKDDWTSFESGLTRSKPASYAQQSHVKTARKPRIGQRLASGSTARTPLRDSRLQATGSASLQQAMQKGALAIADGATDDSAWDDSNDRAAFEASPERSATPSLVPDVERLRLEEQRAPSPGTAFSAKAPWDSHSRADTPSSLVSVDDAAIEDAPAQQGAWSAMDDDESGDEADVTRKSTASDARAAPLSKEAKRLEMERKREERRARMAQLKQSKASKLAADLG